jgi:hypothetical protein
LSGGTLSAQSITSTYSNGGAELIGYGTVSGAVSGNIEIVADGGTLTVQGSLAGDQGIFYIDPGATLELSSGTAQSVYLGGNLTTLKLDTPTAFTGPIYNIAPSDTIDLAGITASSATYSGTTLTINETNGQQLIYDNVSGSVAGDTVTVASDTNGGTLVYWVNASGYTFTTIDAPPASGSSAGTELLGINDAGQILGGSSYSFLYTNLQERSPGSAGVAVEV